MSDDIFGIDLGTSNCLVARALQLWDNTEIETLSDEVDNESFPSVVHFRSEKNVIVGEEAKNLLPEFPDNTIELVKTRIGLTDALGVTINGQKQSFSPQEICAIMLKHFHKLHNNMIKKAILTVPAYFDDNQKKATLQAGTLADIEILELIEEPSAAIMYHLFEAYKEKDLSALIAGNGALQYLVFDFGGGTLDLSMIRVEQDESGSIKPTVQHKGGDMLLGGNIVDFELTRYLLNRLHDEYEDDFTTQLVDEFKYYYVEKRFRPNTQPDVKSFIMILKNSAEQTKIHLSSETKSIVTYGHEDYDNFVLTRDEFQTKVLKPYFKKRIKEAIRSLIDKSNGSFIVDEVVMVGGTSQIPYFKELLESEYPELVGKIVYSKNYKNAIANGAAILGAIYSGVPVKPFGMNRCFNSVGHDIIVNYRGSKEVIIKHSTPYPFSEPIRKSLTIKHSLKTDIELMVYSKTERYDIATEETEPFEQELKHVNFHHPFFYTNEQITVSVNLDEFGLLKFTATHDLTKESIYFESEELHTLDKSKFQTAKERLDAIAEA